MKRRAERSIPDDVNSNRIVRRRGHRTPSPSPVDLRRREVRENSLNYEKYDRSSAKQLQDDRIGKPPIERPPYSREPNAQSSAQYRSFSEKYEYSLRVTNLDFNRSDTDVREALFREFKRFGFINVKVLGFGKDRHAFVNFTREAAARKARRDMQDHQLFNRPIHLDWSKTTLAKFAELNATPPPKRQSVSHEASPMYNDYAHRKRSEDFSDHDDHRDVSYWASQRHHPQSPVPTLPEPSKSTIVEPNATRTLFVGNLELDITEKELRDLFGPYGRIEAVDIKMQRSAGTAYAFVKFVTINDAINAKSDMHSRQYGDYRLKIGFGKGSPTAKVWLGNLTSYADLSEIRHELDRFGLIRRVDYCDGDNHAFVHFDSFDAAQTAVSTLTGYRFKTTGLPLKIDISRFSHAKSEFDDMVEPSDWLQERNIPQHDKHSFSNEEASHATHRKKLRDREARFRGDANGKHSSPPQPSSHFRVGKLDGGIKDVVARGHDADFEPRVRRKRPHTPPPPQPSLSAASQPFDHPENTRKHQQSSSDSVGGDHGYRSKRARGIVGEEHSERDRSHSTHRHGNAEKLHSIDAKKPSSSEQHTTEPGDGGGGGGGRRPSDKSKVSLPVCEIPLTMADPTNTDTALKLSDTTEPISPDSEKSIKPDSGPPETLADLAKLYPVAWRGNLVLKNTGFPTRMHLVGGDPAVAETLLRSKDGGRDDSCTLRITQRLRLEPPRLEEVNKRMSTAGPSGHCVMLALPGPTPSQSSPEHGDNSMQLRPLKSLVSYLKQKEAAGIVALSPNEGCSIDSVLEKDLSKDVIGVLHAFPPCQFSQQQLLRIAPSLNSEPSKEDHIVVLLVKGTV